MVSINHPSIMKSLLPVHLSNRFTFKNATFIAEASDFKRERLTGQVFNDACDEGFIIQSIATGKRVVYLLANVEYDRREGELLAWRYEPLADQGKGVDGTSVVIFND